MLALKTFECPTEGNYTQSDGNKVYIRRFSKQIGSAFVKKRRLSADGIKFEDFIDNQACYRVKLVTTLDFNGQEEVLTVYPMI